MGCGHWTTAILALAFSVGEVVLLNVIGEFANAGNLPNEPFFSWKVWYQVPLVASGVQCGVLALGLAAAAASRNRTFLRIIAVAAWVTLAVTLGGGIWVATQGDFGPVGVVGVAGIFQAGAGWALWSFPTRDAVNPPPDPSQLELGHRGRRRRGRRERSDRGEEEEGEKKRMLGRRSAEDEVGSASGGSESDSEDSLPDRKGTSRRRP